MSVNQDNNTLAKRTKQFSEISNEHDFLNKKVRTLKSGRSSYTGKITYNINKISKFRIIEMKKSVEAHNPIMPYPTKTKESVSSTSVFSENKDSELKLSNNSGKSTPLKTKQSTRGSDWSGISSISSDLSNDRTSYITIVERSEAAEEAKLIALQAKECAKR